jgi:two-component system, LytTR family, response regulator
MIRVLMTDDEPVALRRMRRLLRAADDVDIVGECGDGASAVEAIRELKPDVVLLDVQMPELDGFGVVQALGAETLPAIIFVTAYDRYALRAFDVHALDYVLKPVDQGRLLLAIDRARTRIATHRHQTMDARMVALLEDLTAQRRYLTRLPVRSERGVRVIDLVDVEWISASDNYVTLHAAGREYLLRDTMTRLERQLNPTHFVRIHRSTIVQVDRIHELLPAFHGDYTIVLKDGTRLTLTRGYRPKVEEALGRKI